jgi:hypothetical protein
LAAPLAYAASEVHAVLRLWFPLIHWTSSTGEVEAVFSSPFRRRMGPIAPFVPRRRVPVTVRENLRERLITTTFISEGLKNLDAVVGGFRLSAARLREFAYGPNPDRDGGGGDLSVPGRPEDPNSSHGNVIGLLLAW